MATTPGFGWPYQTLSDPPNGAILGEDLALAIEATVQSQVAALATRLDTIEGAWTTWSSTPANLTVGAGTLTTERRLVGKTVDWRLRFVFGAGSAVGTDPKFTLPVAPHADYVVSGEALFPGKVWLLDTGTRFQKGDLRHDASGVLTLVQWNAINQVASITSTSPWTWATGDTINAYGTYETA